MLSLVAVCIFGMAYALGWDRGADACQRSFREGEMTARLREIAQRHAQGE
jgi:hypothetical protein